MADYVEIEKQTGYIYIKFNLLSTDDAVNLVDWSLGKDRWNDSDIQHTNEGYLILHVGTQKYKVCALVDYATLSQTISGLVPIELIDGVTPTNTEDLHEKFNALYS